MPAPAPRLSFSPLSHPTRRPTTSSAASSPTSPTFPTLGRRRPSRRDSTMSSRSFLETSQSEYDDADDEEWDGGEHIAASSKRGGAGKGAKADEPMSPVVVVLYVTALYLIFQILTRSDEHEILSHLPSTSSFLSPSSASLPGMSHLRDSSPHPYPYHLPPIPSPLPGPAAGGSSSIWKVLLGVAIYPFYLLITLLATPIPLLLNVLHLIVDVVATLLYPLTSTTRVLTRTFLLAPLSLVRQVLAAFYPVYVFVAGVVGVGCVMGVGAGWLGTLVLDKLFGRRRRSSKRSKTARSSLSGTATATTGKPPGTSTKTPSRPSRPTRTDSARRRLPSSSAESHMPLKTPDPVLHPPGREVFADQEDFLAAKGGEARAYGTGREGRERVLGVRRRTSQLGAGSSGRSYH